MDKLTDYLKTRNVPDDTIQRVQNEWTVTVRRRSMSNTKYYEIVCPTGAKYKSFVAAYDAITTKEEQEVNWEVEEILDMRVLEDGSREFLLKWAPSWHKEQDLDDCKDAIQDFLKNNK